MVKQLAELLKRDGYEVHLFYEYHNRELGLDGEMDIYAVKGDEHEYHEIKGKNTPEQYEKAKEQFRRAKHAFPDRAWEFFYHTPHQSMRVTIKDD